MYGWELRERRRAAGLTLRQVARAAGTAETNVAAYERGAKRPHPETLARLAVAVDAGADSPIHRQTLLTFPAAAAALRHGLREAWPMSDLLRVVRELRSHAQHLVTDVDRAAYFARPTTTGDARWDAMLAGCCEDLCLNQGLAVPAWSAGHALPTFWFVGSSPSLRAYAFAHTPLSLQVRGVMVDPADLVAV